MSVIRTTYANRDEWLADRDKGIGASEIGTVLGYGTKTVMRLWEEKLHQVAPTDLTNNPRVQFGNVAEEPLREMFRLMHPEYELIFEPFTVLTQEGEYSFLRDTPDGELIEKTTGRRGLYESKTGTCLSKADWDKWFCKVPDMYFCQICQGMFCGDFDFAVIWALLLNSEGDGTLRAYQFERSDCEWQIDDIKKQGKRFWHNVTTRTMPPMVIRF